MEGTKKLRRSKKKQKKGKGRQSYNDKLVARARARQKEKAKEEKKDKPTLAQRLNALQTLPEFFQRIYYTGDAEMEDGHRVAHIISDGGIDIRSLHVFFDEVLGTEFVIAITLQQTPAKKRGAATLFRDVTRCPEIEKKLNSKRKLATYSKAQRVVMYHVLIPAIGSEDWDVHIDIKPIHRIVLDRLERTMALLDLSLGLKCPLCRIPPPCSHFSKSSKIAETIKSRRSVHTLMQTTNTSFKEEHGRLPDATDLRRLLHDKDAYCQEIRHPERFDGTMKYNYNHLKHMPDGRIPRIAPLKVRRCPTCTLPMPRGAKACPACERASPSVAVKRRYKHTSASFMFNRFCDQHGV